MKTNVRGVRYFALIGLVALGLLLYRFWFGESGWFAVRTLAADVAAQQRLTEELAERNRLLTVEVLALKEAPRCQRLPAPPHDPASPSPPATTPPSLPLAADCSTKGLDAVEARARTDLGMIAEDEIFYLIVDPPPQP